MADYLVVQFDPSLDTENKELLKQEIEHISGRTTPSNLYNAVGELIGKLEGIVSPPFITDDTGNPRQFAQKRDCAVFELTGISTKRIEPLSENMVRLMEDLKNATSKVYRRGEDEQKSNIIYEMASEKGDILVSVNHHQLSRGNTTQGIETTIREMLMQRYLITEDIEKAWRAYPENKQKLTADAEAYAGEVQKYFAEITLRRQREISKKEAETPFASGTSTPPKTSDDGINTGALRAAYRDAEAYETGKTGVPSKPSVKATLKQTAPTQINGQPKRIFSLR